MIPLKRRFLILLIILLSATLTAQDLSFFKDATQLELKQKPFLRPPQKMHPKITVKKQ